jgi:threonine efflux protein
VHTTLLTVFVFHWAILVTPGANVVLVSTLAADRSRADAVFASLGITCVAGLWALLAALGIGGAFNALPAIRLALQIAGGAYLVAVALRLWHARGSATVGSPLRDGRHGAFRLGFLTNVTNPKSALFFGSLFASALPPDPSTALVAAAVAIVVFNALAWHLSLAVVLSQPRVRVAYARKRRTLNRGAALLVGVFGTRLLALAARDLAQELYRT